MTGVGDILWAARRVARRTRLLKPIAITFAVLETVLCALLPAVLAAGISSRLLPDWWRHELRAAASRWSSVPKQHIPDGRVTLRMLAQAASSRSIPTPLTAFKKGSHETTVWALLLPLTSRRAPNDDESDHHEFEQRLWHRLEHNLRRLAETTDTKARAEKDAKEAHHRQRLTKVYVAVDLRDPVFDTAEARARITLLLCSFDAVVFVEPLPPAYQGALCWIWALLARRAVEQDGADYFILLGDDVEMLHGGWQADVEERFADISRERKLPFGCGCVALRDESFPGFPTFPVMHRFHLDAFQGELFPPEFRNQHGDPFLYEVYRRWGASRFTHKAALVNAVGGAGDARYSKVGSLVWRNQILTTAISSLKRYLCDLAGGDTPQAATVPCIDVVVPTFRCDVGFLKALASLECERDASVHTHLVVDRPDAPSLSQVRALASYAPNRVVRVSVLPQNGGAAAARNIGLGQCFSDHCVLLDDDVEPQPGLLDAYLGAIDREPGAAAYVGLTLLPPPVTLWERALAACKICYFYGIAKVAARPPWGVTANLCVRGRTNNSVQFSPVFPRTGGGEDVDFCIRIQMKGPGGLVGVPGAQVLHPYWERPLQQIRGWASGDVLCLDTLPHRAFRTLPNWAEIVLLCALLALSCALTEGSSAAGPTSSALRAAAVAVAVEVAMLLPRFYANAGDFSHKPHVRAASALLGVVPPMLQDVTRLTSKLCRLRLSQLGAHFDWMNGTGRHPQEMLLTSAAKVSAFLLAACAADALPPGMPSATALVGGGSEWRRSVAGGTLAVGYGIWSARQASILSMLEPRLLRGAPLSFTPESGITPFVVLAYQRTGSNLLCGYLSAIAGCSMHFELYNEKAAYRRNGRSETDPALLRLRDANPCGFFNVAMRDRGHDATSVGFKLFPEHVTRGSAHQHTKRGESQMPPTLDFFERLLADPRVKKVILRRENRVATCSSVMRSSVTGSFAKDNLDHVPVHIEPADLHAFIKGFDGYYEYLRERTAGQRLVELTYESLVGDTEGELRRVCEHIGVRVAAGKLVRDKGVEQEVVKQTSRPLRESIANFNELRAAFAGTERAPDFF